MEDTLAALAALSVGVVIQRTGGDITFCNPAAERILGLSRDQMAGRSSLDPRWRAIHENGSPFPGETHPAMVTLRTGEAVHGEVMGVHRPDGSLKWISINAEPIPGPDGHPGSVVAIFTEITERKRAEESIRLSEELKAAVINSTPMHVAVLDANGSIREVNEPWTRFAVENGTEPGRAAARTFVGTNYLEVCAGSLGNWSERANEAIVGIKAVLDGKAQSFSMEYPCHSPETRRWFTMMVTPLRHSDRGAVVVHSEITDRVLAEEALRASQQEYRRIVEAVQDGIWRIDAESKTTFVNQRMADLLGYTPEEMIGKTPFAFMDDEYRAETESRPDRGRRQGFADFHDRRYRRKDGSTVWTILTSSPLLLKDGSYAGAVATVTDITERKQAEENLRESDARIRLLNADLERRVAARTAELEEANKELDAFAHSVSHDLRAPLRAIEGFSEMLVKDSGERLSPEDRRRLEVVRTKTQKMSALIDDLLRLSRASRSEMRKVSIDMTRMVKELVGEIVLDTQGNGFEIRVDELEPASGDVALVRVVFGNLLSNAVKYSGKKERPVIEVGCRPGPGGPEYFVKDNGVGFSMKYAGDLFGVFKRLHDAREFEGTGIGLALVKRIVEKHGGTVRAEGVVGEGATFYFTLGPAVSGLAGRDSPSE